MSKSTLNPRSYNFCGVIYEEHLKVVMDYLRSYTDRGVIRAYYIIRHDAENEDNQVHWHLLIEYYDAKTLTSVNKKIDVRDGLIQYCSDVREYACYLIHKYEIDKKRYKIEQVDTNDKERFVMLVNSENSNQCNADKVFLLKAYDLIKNRYDLCFADILETLVRDKNYTALQVRRYTQHLDVCFRSWRYYEDTEKGLGKWNYKHKNLEYLDK